MSSVPSPTFRAASGTLLTARGLEAVVDTPGVDQALAEPRFTISLVDHPSRQAKTVRVAVQWTGADTVCAMLLRAEEPDIPLVRMIRGECTLDLCEGDYILRMAALAADEATRSKWTINRFSVAHGALGNRTPTVPPGVVETMDLSPPALRRPLGIDGGDGTTVVIVEWDGDAADVILMARDLASGQWRSVSGGPRLALALPDGRYQFRAASLDRTSARRSNWSPLTSWQIEGGDVLPVADCAELRGLARHKTDDSLAMPEDVTCIVAPGAENHPFRLRISWKGSAMCAVAWQGSDSNATRFLSARDGLAEIGIHPGQHRFRMCAIEPANTRRSGWANFIKISVDENGVLSGPGAVVNRADLLTRGRSSDIPAPGRLSAKAVASEGDGLRLQFKWSDQPDELQAALALLREDAGAWSARPVGRDSAIVVLPAGSYRARLCFVDPASGLRGRWTRTVELIVGASVLRVGGGDGDGEAASFTSLAEDIGLPVPEIRRLTPVGSTAQGTECEIVLDRQGQRVLIGLQQTQSGRWHYHVTASEVLRLPLADGDWIIRAAAVDLDSGVRGKWSNRLALAIRDGVVSRSIHDYASDLFPPPAILWLARSGAPVVEWACAGHDEFVLEAIATAEGDGVTVQVRGCRVELPLPPGSYTLRICAVDHAKGLRSEWSTAMLAVVENGHATLTPGVYARPADTLAAAIADEQVQTQTIHYSYCRLGEPVSADLPDCRTLVIGGAPRTGTTLIQEILCAAPTASPLLSEAVPLRHLVEAYQRTARHLKTFPGMFFSDENALETLYTRWAEEFLEALRMRYACQDLVLKEPELTKLLPVFSTMVREARFVIMVRDPRAAIASMIEWGERAKAKGRSHFFQNRDMGELTGYFRNFYAPLLSNRSEELLRRIRYVRYEDLVIAPQEVAGKLSEFCGVDLTAWTPDDNWTKVTMDFRDPNLPVADAITDLYGRAVSASRLEAWRDVLRAEEIEQIEAALATFMRRFQYM